MCRLYMQTNLIQYIVSLIVVAHLLDSRNIILWINIKKKIVKLIYITILYNVQNWVYDICTMYIEHAHTIFDFKSK